MKWKEKIARIATISLLLISITIPSLNTFLIVPVNADIVGGIGHNAWHNDSELTVHVLNYEPRVNWYDFQYNNSGTWISRLNKKIEIDNSSEYRFIINISSDQGWDDIEFINITAWYDHGNETNVYNQTLGGNINLYTQYENTTSTSNMSEYRTIWPKNEVTFTGYAERIVSDNDYGFPNLTEARNLTFSFIPQCQFRYAPGENEIWNNSTQEIDNTSKYGLYNNWSWNFNITITDSGEGTAGIPSTTYITDEFGVYAYTEIISAQNPRIIGFPDANVSSNSSGSGNISIVTISNGNYSLALNISNLQHKANSNEYITNDNLYIRGGNRTIWRNLSNLTYLFGGGENAMPTYHTAENNGNFVNSTNVEFKCYIPIGQLAGEYSTPIYYYLHTQQ